ncbi:MAG: hypothetical protein OXI01_06655 [Albidovulum sp.]|nr:hypothetical protein [Albidovulum sp.]
MRKVKKTLAFHFGEGRSARAIATHCGIARRSVMQTLERFAASGPSWLEELALLLDGGRRGAGDQFRIGSASDQISPERLTSLCRQPFSSSSFPRVCGRVASRRLRGCRRPRGGAADFRD